MELSARKEAGVDAFQENFGVCKILQLPWALLLPEKVLTGFPSVVETLLSWWTLQSFHCLGFSQLLNGTLCVDILVSGYVKKTSEHLGAQSRIIEWGRELLSCQVATAQL